MTRPLPDPLSAFWSPVCAIGAHGPHGPNAQISVSVFGAGVVPDHPRLLVNLWKDNYTADLVTANGSLAITILAASQSNLIEPLGLNTGAVGPKLTGLDFELTAAGDPYFPRGVAVLECEVIERLDFGDAWAFLVAVRNRRRLSEEPPASREQMMSLVSDDVRQRWSAKINSNIPAYRQNMHWRD